MKNKLTKYVIRILAGLLGILTIAVTLFLFLYIFWKGKNVMSLSFILDKPAGVPLGTAGGIYPALMGSIYLGALSALMGGIIGIGVAVYLVFYTRKSIFYHVISACITGLSGIPSILFGLVGYTLLIYQFGLGRSLLCSAICVAVMIVPFVKIYTANVSDANYIEPLFGVLLTVAAFITCLSSPYSSSVIAAGHFRQTRWAAYGEALVNVLLSILLVRRFGLIGVAVGTVVATLYKLIFYVVYLKKNILNRKISCFFKREFINLSTVALIFVIGKYILTFFDISNYAQWVLAAVVITVLACLVTIGSNVLFYRNDCIALLHKVIHRG